MECAIFLWTLYIFSFARQQFIYGMHRLSKTFHTNPYFFNAAIWLGISLALYSAYFVGTEYHDGVLRSQVIAGYKRSVIYLSHYLIILLAILMLYFGYATVAALLEPETILVVDSYSYSEEKRRIPFQREESRRDSPFMCLVYILRAVWFFQKRFEVKEGVRMFP